MLEPVGRSVVNISISIPGYLAPRIDGFADAVGTAQSAQIDHCSSVVEEGLEGSVASSQGGTRDLAPVVDA